VRTILPHPEALANDVRFQVAVADAAILPPKGVPSIRSSTRGIASCASAKETHSNIVAIAKLNISGVQISRACPDAVAAAETTASD
jgi:hypothetical protein